MVRFSNSKLKNTQYIITGITGSTGTIIIPISSAYSGQRKVMFASDYIAAKTAVGVSSTAYDVALASGMPDPNVDLGLLYSNGYRYQYINFKAGTTGCSVEVPDKIITVSEQTDSGTIYYDQSVSGYTLIKAYVGNNIVIPQNPNPNVPTIAFPPPSKVEVQLTNNNNC
jgi:hypothetical protein